MNRRDRRAAAREIVKRMGKEKLGRRLTGDEQREAVRELAAKFRVNEKKTEAPPDEKKPPRLTVVRKRLWHGDRA